MIHLRHTRITLSEINAEVVNASLNVHDLLEGLRPLDVLSNFVALTSLLHSPYGNGTVSDALSTMISRQDLFSRALLLALQWF